MAAEKKTQALPAALGATFAERKKARLAREGKAVESAENKSVASAQSKQRK